MKLKIGLWIIGIILVLAIFGSLLSDEDSGNTITSNVIKEEVSEEPILIAQEETAPEEIVKIVTLEPTNYLYRVTRVIDGDTIELSSGEKVRLICIDTPERGEDGYSEATDYLESLVLNEDVELVKDVSEKDRYGRLLRYIYLEDGTFVNEMIVYKGYGKAYLYNPDTSKCPIIQKAEQHAKSNKLGIWKETIEQKTSTNSNIICSYNAYNCGDFSTCSEVMEVFNSCSYDIHYLDGDDDGIPCESLCG